MPRYMDWKANDAHHKLLSAAMDAGRKSDAAAKALHADFARPGKRGHTASIAETIPNKHSQVASKIADGHEILKGGRARTRAESVRPRAGRLR